MVKYLHNMENEEFGLEKIKNEIEEAVEEEKDYLDQALRPSLWKDYIGQKTIKDNLEILIKAAKERKSAPEHILFYGPPGLGKTTLANLVAKELNTNMRITSGPAIMKVGDLAAILTNLSDGDVLFIDEIHRLNKLVEEVLYPAMESGKLDIIIGKGPSARTIQLDLPRFTLIGATTRVSLLSSPLRSRFSGGVHRLQYYNEEEIAKIVKNSSKILNIKITDDAALEIAKRSRFTPRTANYLLKRCRDYAQVNKAIIDMDVVNNTLTMLEIDDMGLGIAERMLLNTLVNVFPDKPVGLNTLSASTGEEENTLEDVVEPYLLQIGFIDRTTRGRIVTEKGKEHMRKLEK
ncbi:Holliday junction ATP-dependent DNA helicase RuvB [bioreactor metagenome]|uniref:Holliday junction ATP-dependent DNA helicase RuvB n=1 Tax=bioreactor metagenome TaxID=1076179 RepID=A0A644UA69_9ZZZZ